MVAAADTKQTGHRCNALSISKWRITVPRLLRAQWAARRPRPWLAVIATPLAMIATAGCGLWWIWPVLIVCSRAWTRNMIWSWVLSIEEGLIGWEWALVGATSLAVFSSDRALVGSFWIGFPLAVAIVGWHAHRMS